VAELTGDATGGGARNDRVRLAAPVPIAALEPGATEPGGEEVSVGGGSGNNGGSGGGGCLAEHMCEVRDVLIWVGMFVLHVSPHPIPGLSHRGHCLQLVMRGSSNHASPGLLQLF